MPKKRKVRRKRKVVRKKSVFSSLKPKKTVKRRRKVRRKRRVTTKRRPASVVANPKRKRKVRRRKRKATPAQLRNLAKGRAKLRAMRRKGRKTTSGKRKSYVKSYKRKRRNPAKKRRKTWKFWRRNPGPMLRLVGKQLLGVSVGFFGARALANYASVSNIVPLEFQKYAPIGAHLAAAALAYYGGNKVKKVKPYQTAILTGIGLSLLEAIVMRFAPADMADYVIPADLGLGADLSVYEAALSGNGLDEGWIDYLPGDEELLDALEAQDAYGEYIEEPMGEYIEEPMGEYIEEPMGEYIEEPMGEYIEEPMGAFEIEEAVAGLEVEDLSDDVNEGIFNPGPGMNASPAYDDDAADETLEIEEGDVLDLGGFEIEEAVAGNDYEEYDIRGLGSVKSKVRALRARNKARRSRRRERRQERRADRRGTSNGASVGGAVARQPAGGAVSRSSASMQAGFAQAASRSGRVLTPEDIARAAGISKPTSMTPVRPVPLGPTPSVSQIQAVRRASSAARPAVAPRAVVSSIPATRRLTKPATYATRIHAATTGGGIFGEGTLKTYSPQPTQRAESAAISAVQVAGIVAPRAKPAEKLQIAYDEFKAETQLPASPATRALFVSSVRQRRRDLTRRGGTRQWKAQGAPMPVRPITATSGPQPIRQWSGVKAGKVPGIFKETLFE